VRSFHGSTLKANEEERRLRAAKRGVVSYVVNEDKKNRQTAGSAITKSYCGDKWFSVIVGPGNTTTWRKGGRSSPTDRGRGDGVRGIRRRYVRLGGREKTRPGGVFV